MQKKHWICILPFILCLLTPGFTLAVDHIMEVHDDNGPVGGLSVRIYIKVGAGNEASDWQDFNGFTDLQAGQFIVDATPHSNATFWIVEITEEGVEPEQANPDVVFYNLFWWVGDIEGEFP